MKSENWFALEPFTFSNVLIGEQSILYDDCFERGNES